MELIRLVCSDFRPPNTAFHPPAICIYMNTPNGRHNPLAMSAAKSKSGSCHWFGVWPSLLYGDPLSWLFFLSLQAEEVFSAKHDKRDRIEGGAPRHEMVAIPLTPTKLHTPVIHVDAEAFKKIIHGCAGRVEDNGCRSAQIL